MPETPSPNKKIVLSKGEKRVLGLLAGLLLLAIVIYFLVWGGSTCEDYQCPAGKRLIDAAADHTCVDDPCSQTDCCDSTGTRRVPPPLAPGSSCRLPPDTSGYTVENSGATTVSELGTISCADGYDGEGAATCGENNVFVLTGCNVSQQAGGGGRSGGGDVSGGARSAVQNCIGSWGDWGDCNCDTLQRTRTYSISTRGGPGGTPCPPPETKACTPSEATDCHPIIRCNLLNYDGSTSDGNPPLGYVYDGAVNASYSSNEPPSIGCADGYHPEDGIPPTLLPCTEEGGYNDISHYTGCSPNTCSAPPQSPGYIIPEDDGQHELTYWQGKLSGSDIQCDRSSGYTGSPTVTCPSHEGPLQLHGCRENVCIPSTQPDYLSGGTHPGRDGGTLSEWQAALDGSGEMHWNISCAQPQYSEDGTEFILDCPTDGSELIISGGCSFDGITCDTSESERRYAPCKGGRGSREYDIDLKAGAVCDESSGCTWDACCDCRGCCPIPSKQDPGNLKMSDGGHIFTFGVHAEQYYPSNCRNHQDNRAACDRDSDRCQWIE